MKAAVMQPYLFPYIGYFQLINAVDTFVVYDDVNYIKKGWINRNSILVNEKPFLFTVDLKEVSQNKLINEITIDENSNWKKNILRTIELSYKKAPFFFRNFSDNPGYNFIRGKNLAIYNVFFKRNMSFPGN